MKQWFGWPRKLKQETLSCQYEEKRTGTAQGWYTIEQISEKLGARRNLIESLVARKKYEIKKCRALSKDGKLVMINHYHTGKL